MLLLDEVAVTRVDAGVSLGVPPILKDLGAEFLMRSFLLRSTIILTAGTLLEVLVIR